ncbi:hypothetical protein H6G83_03290 [Anabaena azotica FACHB-119]|uniref:Uncharacterized protein n=1 Tax=Anabaena azotica FACHB-119 TaxID=947527 RepID=A0ABR8CYA7_9NOST|nr:hypothetical protein [Anabaena azotica FACHB-119]
MKRFLISVFTPTFVQDLGFILPGFRIRSSPLDLLRLLFVRFTAISYTTTKAALEGRGFKPSFSVNAIPTAKSVLHLEG